MKERAKVQARKCRHSCALGLVNTNCGRLSCVPKKGRLGMKMGSKALEAVVGVIDGAGDGVEGGGW